MARVIITFKIMPNSPDIELEPIRIQAEEKVKAFGAEVMKHDIEPIAFGLKAIQLTINADEDKGSTDDLEADITSIDGVQSCEVSQISRALG